jgi:Protein of unknown function (DUF2971).
MTPLEIEYTASLLKNIIVKRELQKLINWHAFISVIQFMLENSYILSLSKNPDNLVMWSNYAKFEGLCIHFSRNGFSRIEDVKLDNDLYLHKIFNVSKGSVIYDEKKQTEILNSIIDNYAELIQDGVANDSDEFYRVITLFKFCFCVFKQKGLHNEEEFRYIFTKGNNSAQVDTDLDFRFSNNLIIPYVKIPLNAFQIEAITVSPKVSDNRIKESIAFFMASNRFKDTLYDSGIILK